MAIIKMSSKKKLDLQEMRLMIQNLKTRDFVSKQHGIKLHLEPVKENAKGKIFAAGTAYIDNKRIKIYACKCEFSDGTHGLTLRKKYGDYIDETVYIAMEKILLKVLKILFCHIVDTQIDRVEFVSQETEKGIGQSVIATIKSGRHRSKNEKQMQLGLVFA